MKQEHRRLSWGKMHLWGPPKEAAARSRRKEMLRLQHVDALCCQMLLCEACMWGPRKRS